MIGKALKEKPIYVDLDMSHLHYIKPQRRGLKDFFQKYLRPRSGTIAGLVIDYIHDYDSFGVSIQIKNFDGTNVLQYAVNSIEPLETIAASGTQVINDTYVELLRIVPHGTTGDWEVSHMGVSYYELTREPTGEKV